MVKSVLFVCNMNSVRSPMAAALMRAGAKGVTVDSAGVYEGALDHFVEGVLGEIGLDTGGREPKSLDGVIIEDFDVLIALTPEAAQAMAARAPKERIELWDIANPSGAVGGRDAILAAYREVREDISRRLAQRFKGLYHKP